MVCLLQFSNCRPRGLEERIYITEREYRVIYSGCFTAGGLVPTPGRLRTQPAAHGRAPAPQDPVRGRKGRVYHVYANCQPGIYIMHFDHPPPLLRFKFFPRQIGLRRAGRIFWVYSSKRCNFKALFLFFNVIFLLFSLPFFFFSPADHSPPPLP